MTLHQLLDKLRAGLSSGLGIPIAILALLGLITIPLPPFLLDVFFTFNIALSLVVLVVTLYVRRPLEFAIFPTIILVATLFRLALNIASTRVILLEGHQGPDAAGKVIESFGEFVIGGNYAVGLIIFAILVVINFVVVTKGATRVAEVSARFTLDSMPGKQMAIDADLNAGLITQEEAQQRRREIAMEADFYGAMDGASKFVRGDAVAGIVILFINILGGLFVGMVQHGLPFSQAVETYTLLTIGDGLVAQIPSILLSTATAIIITRINSDEEGDMARQLQLQLFASPRVLAVTAGILGVMGVIPGMPNVAFLSLAALVGALAWWVARQQQQKAETPVDEVLENEEAAKPADVTWDDVGEVDPLGLEVGYRLIPMVDQQQGGELLDRIRGVRRKLSQELGFLIPPVHIRDNLDLKPTQYRILIYGVSAGEGEVYPDRDLAINPGQVYGEIKGIPTKDPTFGLDALWIDPADRDQAQAMGYTVVDASTVIATHLSHLIQEYAWQLLGPDEVQTLLDRVKQHSPKLVEELVPDKLPLAVVVKVLQNLLREKVPIRNLRTILQALNEHAAHTQDPEELTMHVRAALGRAIVDELVGPDGPLHVITLEPSLEQLLLQAAQNSPQGQLTIDPGLAERLYSALNEQVQKLEAEGRPAVLLVAPQIRAQLARLLRYSLPNLHVLAYTEVPEDRQIQVVAAVGQASDQSQGSDG
ncbi:flagellar biosynthesis protein FlhA [Sulfurivirga sp.]|uniref:flagellar biosynthesis protein FlhA n=1 Tax=Sulfurivirga sp. TaxID=2614236 RepID=UPI0025D3E774|nr:flagellar biosynthesis protein FlhA [Sulfurivirga sp.]